MFLKRVITLTASVESGTGEPIPISSPVSRGRSLLGITPDVELSLLPNDSGLP